jgi:hypothetical protein
MGKENLESKINLKVKEKLKNDLESKKIGKNYKHLLKDASKIYDVQIKNGHAKVYDKKGRTITIIPVGINKITKGTWIKIHKSLIHGKYIN